MISREDNWDTEIIMSDTELTREELDKQIEELKRQIDHLTHGDYDEDAEPECVKWNLYEECIANDPLSFIHAHLEQEDTALNTIKNKRITELKGCLRFFPGANATERKTHFLSFLRHFAGYRTKNLRLLEQRLFLTRRWLKQNNIPCKLHELHLYLKLNQ